MPDYLKTKKILERGEACFSKKHSNEKCLNSFRQALPLLPHGKQDYQRDSLVRRVDALLHPIQAVGRDVVFCICGFPLQKKNRRAESEEFVSG